MFRNNFILNYFTADCAEITAFEFGRSFIRFRLNTLPASGGTALLRLSRHSPALVKGRRRIGFCLLSTLN
jgi:hypothetical protein